MLPPEAMSPLIPPPLGSWPEMGKVLTAGGGVPSRYVPEDVLAAGRALQTLTTIYPFVQQQKKDDLVMGKVRRRFLSEEEVKPDMHSK